MKKILLLVLMSVVCTATFAQSVELTDETEVVVPQRRSVSSGMYYAKPLGMMYFRSFDTGISGDGVYFPFIWSRYCYPCFEDFTYINMSTNPSATRWNYKEVLGEEGTYLEGDADGNITQCVDLGDSLSVLYLYNETGTEYYNMAYKENYSSSSVGKGLHYIYGADRYDGYAWIGWIDHMTRYNSAAATSTMYRYGRGTINLTLSAYDAGHYGESQYLHSVTKDWAIDHVETSFYAPASPLYVKDVYCAGVTYSNSDDSTLQPIKNGAELKMEVLDQATSEVLLTLTATAGDWEAVNFTSATNTHTGHSETGWTGYLRFSNKVDGEEVPFVIDRAITMRLLDLTNEDFEIGLGGNPLEGCIIDEGLDVSRLYFTDPDGEYEVVKGISQSATYSSNDAMCVSLNAVMDRVLVDEEYSNVVISDGTGYFYIRTTLPWFDADGKENYTLVDAPDWLNAVIAEAYGDKKNTYKVELQVAENTGDERIATVYVQCKGYVDSTPITITQTAYGSMGINEVTTSETSQTSALYNLVGQRVSDTAKGIVIKNGKKLLNK